MGFVEHPNWGFPRHRGRGALHPQPQQQQRHHYPTQVNRWCSHTTQCALQMSVVVTKVHSQPALDDTCAQAHVHAFTPTESQRFVYSIAQAAHTHCVDCDMVAGCPRGELCWPTLVGWRFLHVCVPSNSVVSCSAFQLLMPASPSRLLVTKPLNE